MSLAPTVTAGELISLAKPSVPIWYAVYDDAGGTSVGTARIASTPTYPVSTLPITGQSAGWGNVKPDQVVLVGSTAGGFDRGIFRLRWQATGADYPNLQIEQIGANDSGEIDLASRNTSIQVNDYVTVLDRFDLFGKNPRIDYSGVGTTATIYEDYDRATFTDNRYPAPFINVWIDGVAAHYATHVYAATSKTFDIVFQPWSWNSATVTWSVVLPAGWTLNSGALSGSAAFNSTVTLNVTAPHSANSYKLQIIVTDPTGTSSQMTAVRKVWIKSNTYPPISIVSIDSDVDDRTGSRRTITFNQLANFPPGAMWHLFDMGSWGGSNVPTARKCFSGWAVGRRETTDIGVANVQLDVAGPSYILDLIGGQSQIMTAVNATPASYQEIWYQFSFVDFIIWWILYQRVGGLLAQFNYNPIAWPSVANWYMTDWRIDAGSLLSQIQIQAKRVRGGNFGCDPTGEMWFRSHVSRVPWSERSAIPIRASLNAGMYKHADLGQVQRPEVRRLRGEAFYSDGLTVDTPYWSDAPVVAGQGQRDEKLERMLVRTESELWDVTGQEYQARNNPYPHGSLSIPKNWAVFYPAQMTRVSLDIAPALRYDGVDYNGYILPIQVSYAHNPDGTIDTEISFEAETVGVPGVHFNIPVIDPTTGTSPYQFIPFAPVPPWRSPNPNPAGTAAGPAVIPKDGSNGFAATSSKPYAVSNILGTPKYQDITPAGGLGAFTIKHGAIKNGQKRIYRLDSDGANSRVSTAPDLFAKPLPTWSLGAPTSGVYTTIREGNAAGEVLIYTAADTGTITTDTNANNGEPVSIIGDWQGGFPADNGVYENAQIFKVSITGILTQITYTLIVSHGFPAGTISWEIQTVSGGLPTGTVLASGTSTPVQSAVNTILVSGGPSLTAGTSYALVLRSTSVQVPDNYWQWSFSSANPYPDGTRTYRNTSFTSTWTAQSAVDNQCTITVSGGVARVKFSTDHGATFGSPLTVGSPAGTRGGFDVQHNGAVSIAASTLKTRKATTLGGAYSDDQSWDTDPGCVEMPWSRRNSSALDNTGASPDYIVGLLTADSSNHTWYWVASGIKVNITPVIGGQPGIPVGPDCITTYLGKYIAMLASFGGTMHLVTSKDAGTTWTDRGAVDATYVRVRRLASQPGQFYAAGNVFDYTNTFGAKLVSKSKPGALIFFESYS